MLVWYHVSWSRFATYIKQFIRKWIVIFMGNIQSQNQSDVYNVGLIVEFEFYW